MISGATVWRPIVGYEGRYEVSNDGKVRSLLADPPRERVVTLNPDGYPTVCLFRDGKPKTWKVHVLVAKHHLPEPSVLHREVAHLDGNRTNPRADNLQWVSHRENHFHRRAHGTDPVGERHPRAKLTDAAVRAILRREKPAAELAKDYGVSRHTIYDVWQGNRWTHVSFNRG